MTRRLRCRATTVAGEPCRAPANTVDPDTRLCPAHAPGGREMLSEAGRKGGETMARRFKRRGLDPEVLGNLETVEDCRRWCELIGRAVASGELGHREGATAVRAIEAAQKVLATAAREEIDALRAELRRLKSVKAVR